MTAVARGAVLVAVGIAIGFIAGRTVSSGSDQAGRLSDETKSRPLESGVVRINRPRLPTPRTESASLETTIAELERALQREREATVDALAEIANLKNQLTPFGDVPPREEALGLSLVEEASLMRRLELAEAKMSSFVQNPDEREFQVGQIRERVERGEDVPPVLKVALATTARERVSARTRAYRALFVDALGEERALEMARAARAHRDDYISVATTKLQRGSLASFYDSEHSVSARLLRAFLVDL